MGIMFKIGLGSSIGGLSITTSLILLCGLSSTAQVVPDATLGGQPSILTPGVNIDGQVSDRIDGGLQRGENLFHSFDQFSVLDGDRVYFANPGGIDRIFSRVTGNTISEISGTLGVDGAADLFFLNPNGILFDDNARLDVAGSVVMSTADAIEFDNLGRFDARNPNIPNPLLTIDPSVFQFGQAVPGTIEVRAQGNFGDGLTVPEGDRFLLVGGDVVIDGGILTVPGREVEVISVIDGAVLYDNPASVVDGTVRGDIQFLNDAEIDVARDNAGSIRLLGQTIDILDSRLQSGLSINIITIDFTTGGMIVSEGQAGDIDLDASEQITIANGTLSNLVQDGIVGNGGNINLRAPVITVRGGSVIDAATFGEGNAGSVFITAPDRVILSNSTVFTNVEDSAIGNGGEINIDTGILRLVNGARLTAELLGEGTGGNIRVDARDRILVSGVSPVSTLPSSISSSIASEGNGDGGNILLETGQLRLLNGGSVTAEILGTGDGGNIRVAARDRIIISGASPDALFSSDISSRIRLDGAGNAGNIILNTGQLQVLNGGEVSADIFGEGNGGNIRIDARDRVFVAGRLPNRSTGSNISSTVHTDALGNGGNIRIETDVLDLADHGEISASVAGEGSGGLIRLLVDDRITLANGEIISDIGQQGEGDGGDIIARTHVLQLLDSSRISANVDGTGTGGTIRLNARDRVIISGQPVTGELFGGIFSVVGSNGVGNGGNIIIDTDQFWMRDGAQIDAAIFGRGNGGTVRINSDDNILIDGSNIYSTVEPDGVGSSGNVIFNTSNLRILNAGLVDGSILGDGNGGLIRLNASDRIVISDSIVSTAIAEQGRGVGGNIIANTPILQLLNGGQLTAILSGDGQGGTVQVNARDRVFISGISFTNFEQESGVFSSVSETGSGIGGDIQVRTADLAVTFSGQISSKLEGTGEGGIVDIHTQSLRVTNDGRFDVSISGNGIGGILQVHALDNILISGGTLFSGINSGGVGTGGEIDLATDTLTVTTVGRIDSAVQGRGTGGNIIIDSRIFNLTNSGQLDAAVFQQGRSGAIAITARDRMNISNAQIFSAIEATARGRGGDIIIISDELVVTEGGVIDAAVRGVGSGGDIRLDIQQLQIQDGSAVQASVEESAIGDAGNITIDAQEVDILDRARLAVNVAGDGNAGRIRINARDRITLSNANGRSDLENNQASGAGGDIVISTALLEVLNGAGLLADTQGDGDAGSIRIVATDEVRMAAGSVSTTSDSPSGQGGDIRVNTDRLLLDNESRILTETASTDGGSIFLRLADLLVLRNESLISTEAGTDGAGGNGGNITILSNFIVAPEFENSDIVANAFEGDGGDIQITTEGLYGIEFRPQLTPRSDITASSQFGLAGIVSIDTPGVDPSQDVIELPATLVDPTGLIGQQCRIEDSDIASLGEFYILGGQGLPIAPTEARTRTQPIVRPLSPSTVPLQSLTPPPEPSTHLVQEVQAIQRDAEGNQMLVATPGAPVRFPLRSLTCSPP